MVEERTAYLDGLRPLRLIEEMGAVVYAAKVRASYFDNYMFNYYGDPATTVF